MENENSNEESKDMEMIVQRLNVQTYASFANRYLGAKVMIGPRAAKEVELQLR